MDETITPGESSEVSNQPAEVGFGTVVRSHEDSPDKLFLVINVHGPTGLDRAYIASDLEGAEKIGLPGTYNGKVSVVGKWSKDKVHRALVGMNGYTEDTAPQTVSDMVDRWIQEYSAKPPVIYTGSETTLLEHLEQQDSN